jgi:hypothetical protein
VPDLLGRAAALSPRALFILTAVAYLAVGQHYVSRLQAAGDEPHYLIVAQSLWAERDLDLRDNYARQDFLDYAPAPLTPHYGEPRRDGRPFPAHSPGLPLLLAPVYALGGRRACVALLALAAAALALEARALAARLTEDRRALVFAWAVAAGPPLLFYSFHVYTEVVSGLLMAVALRLLLAVPGPALSAAAAVLASALPWLHVKMIPVAAALGVVALLRLRGRALYAFLAVAAATAAGFVAYHLHVFGTPTPLAIYGGVPYDAARLAPLRAAAGLLFDRSFGLLPHAPVLLLAVAGTWAFARRRELWPYLLVAAAVLVPVLAWRMWWGGMCPPGRFLVPLVPLLAALAALRRVGEPRGLARWGGPLLALGYALALFMVRVPENALLLNRRANPTRVWAALSGGLPLERYLPSLVSTDPADVRVAIVWVSLLGVLLALDAAALRRDSIDRWFRGPRALALPAASIVFLTLLTELWAR